MRSGIYKITFSNGDFYIGSTLDFTMRSGAHKRLLGCGKHHNYKMQKLFDLLEEEIEIKIILICSPKDLLFYEQICIDNFKPELNIHRTAGSAYGAKRTEEEKIKTGNFHRGKKMSEETKAKMSASRLGKPRSEETKAKMRGRKLSVTHVERIKVALKGRRIGTGMLGKRHTEETKAKISMAKIGRKLK